MENGCKRLAARIAVVWCAAVALAWTPPWRRSTPEWTPQLAPLELKKDDRLLILAPHPDDEVLGTGGVIQHAVAMGLPVRVVFLTLGDHNEWSFLIYRKRPIVTPLGNRRMGLVRRNEALAAAKVLGIATNDLVFLGYPDYGTLKIWGTHWGNRPAFHSLLTNTRAVPYKDALRPGAPYKGEEILCDLKTVMEEFRPTKVFVSHPADHNPDHRALYLFARVALWDLEGQMKPPLYPYLVHYAHWPRPRGYFPERALVPPPRLQQEMEWQIYPLTSANEEQKRLALRAHRSQYAYSAGYLLSFIRANELFGESPAVALTRRETTTALGPTNVTSNIATPPHEELTEQERAAFVGIGWRGVRLEGDELVVHVQFSRGLEEEATAKVTIFGYRSDREFAAMPKLQVELSPLGYDVYDTGRKLSDGVVRVDRWPTEVIIHVPLKAAGYPQKILTSARTELGEVPLDWSTWRVVELPEPRVFP
jgi:LmbE family N-acetylglucosaminyl deacetylase